MTNKEYIRREYIKGTPVADIASALGLSRQAVKDRARRDPKCPAHGSLFESDIISSGSSSTGDQIMRKATQADLDALREHCEQHGLPYDARRLWWHKTREFSVSFYDAKKLEEEKAAQDEFLKRLERPAPKTKKSPRPSKMLAIPCNFDVHIGKHCELIRTGNDYTPEKAVVQVLQGLQDQQRDFKHFGVSDVLLPMGNDIVHIDNNSSTTTSGTQQDSYGSVESQMMLAAELYIRLITEYAKRHTVWLCHTHSNHDRVSGWAVSQYVAAWFRNDPRVKWSNDGMSQQHRKYFVFGDNLIMFHHGEGREEKVMGLIEQEARLALSQTNRTYVYQGHTHHKITSKRGINTENIEKDHSALTVVKAGSGAQNRMHVETVRSPSPADTWHSLSQYTNMPAVETFIHDEHAQKYRLTHWF